MGQMSPNSHRAFMPGSRRLEFAYKLPSASQREVRWEENDDNVDDNDGDDDDNFDDVLWSTAHSLWRALGFGMISLRSCACSLDCAPIHF